MKQKGFTLIELLVVIAIIAIISGLVLVRIGSVTVDARNTERKTDLDQVKKAIDQFMIAGGSINSNSCTNCPGGCLTNLSNNSYNFIQGSAPYYPNGYLINSTYPTDPKSGGQYHFLHYNCGGTNTYIIRASGTEPNDGNTSNDVQITL